MLNQNYIIFVADNMNATLNENGFDANNMNATQNANGFEKFKVGGNLSNELQPIDNTNNQGNKYSKFFKY